MRIKINMPKFNRTQKFTKENIEKIPEGKTTIYKLKNSDWKTLYIGIAGRGRGQERLLEHKELKKEKIPGASKFQVAQVKNKEIAKKIEKQLIRKEQPEFNEQNK